LIRSRLNFMRYTATGLPFVMARAPFQVLVLLHRQRPDSSIEYAVFRRADSHVWQAIAGGGEDLETPDAAAGRELLEEAGLSSPRPLMQLATVGAVPVEHFADRHAWPASLRVIPEFSFAIDVGAQEVQLSPEHAEVKWLTIEAAEAILEWESNRAALRELHALLTGGLSAADAPAV
jgi:dATP pyrophosphohydrolase